MWRSPLFSSKQVGIHTTTVVIHTTTITNNNNNNTSQSPSATINHPLLQTVFFSQLAHTHREQHEMNVDDLYGDLKVVRGGDGATGQPTDCA